MKLHKIGIYFLVIALIGVLALGCGDDAATADGDVYTGEAQGFGGTIKVEVTMDEGEIVDIKIVEESETANIGDADSMAGLLDDIIAAGGTGGVDIKSGATVTSEAIFAAVDDALSKAE
ncbi:FMN-binding protein [Candidatus Contubernalis alkaliaceticus]|uniref:FMN-binding protein n=1 Tax=Candidatus Contubernalis alkaliaceticus TaxID=338645 RepID=UPI001F4C3F83|nr:FMN-binding protein [Candidatus Contubernalis alkalaceticus]UNC90900.1 FMN-binding protein [Candidatus Contubernalis alkalaceticus]